MKNENITIAQLVNLITELHGYPYAAGVMQAMIDGHINYGHNGNKAFEEIYDLQHQINTTYARYRDEQFKRMVGLEQAA